MEGWDLGRLLSTRWRRSVGRGANPRARKPILPIFHPSIQVALALSLWVALPAFADRQRVQITQASVKARPYGYVATVAKLPLGAEVEVTGPAENGYVRVAYGESKTGYLLASSLTTPERYKGIEQATSRDARATGESTAAYAAAKGWDKPTEEKYSKAKKLDAEFKLVDQIEKGPYADKSPEEIEKIVLRFASDGKLGDAQPVRP